MKTKTITAFLCTTLIFAACASAPENEEIQPSVTQASETETSETGEHSLPEPEIQAPQAEEPSLSPAVPDEIPSAPAALPEGNDEGEKVEDEEGFFMNENPYDEIEDAFKTTPHVSPFTEPEKTEPAAPAEDEKIETPQPAAQEQEPDHTDVFSEYPHISPFTREEPSEGSQKQDNAENPESPENGEMNPLEQEQENAGRAQEDSNDTILTEPEKDDAGAVPAEGNPDEEGSPEENDDEAAGEYTEEIVPSRKITIEKNQYLDIEYPGTGWVYLGETDEKMLFAYFGRKLNSSANVTDFSLKARQEGTALLNFYKLDRLTGEYIEDYLEVTVTGTSAAGEHVKAPSYAQAVPPRPKHVRKSPAVLTDENTVVESDKVDIDPYGTEETRAYNRHTVPKTAEVSEKKENKKESKKSPSSAPAPKKEEAETKNEDDSGVVTVIQNTNSKPQAKTPVKKATEDSVVKAPEAEQKKSQDSKLEDTANSDASDILELAKKAYSKKKYKDALDYLDSFFKKAVNRLDEGLYLQAQIYESPSSVKNIKKAMDTYEAIVNKYPDSSLWAAAYERMTYLKRFYFSIR